MPSHLLSLRVLSVGILVQYTQAHSRAHSFRLLVQSCIRVLACSHIILKRFCNICWSYSAEISGMFSKSLQAIMNVFWNALQVLWKHFVVLRIKVRNILQTSWNYSYRMCTSCQGIVTPRCGLSLHIRKDKRIAIKTARCNPKHNTTPSKHLLVIWGTNASFCNRFMKLELPDIIIH